MFCLSVQLAAQNPDSLLKLLEQNNKQDTNRVNILTTLASDYEDLSEYDKSISFSNQALKLATALKHTLGIQACYNNLGNCYIDKGDLKTALDFHLKALKIREELNAPIRIAYSHLNIGNIYFRLNELKNAISSYSTCLKIMEQHKDTSGIAVCLCNIGSVYGNLGQVERAEQYYLKSLALRIKIGDTDGVSEAYSNLSVILMDCKKYKESLNYAFKTLEICEQTGSKLSKTIAKSNIGDVYTHLKDYENAIRYQNEALQLSKEMGSLYMIKVCYQMLAEAYEGKGDNENAITFYELYSQASDSLLNSESDNLITEMKTRFETDKKQKEIELLQKDVSIRDLQLSEQQTNIKRQQIVIFSIIGGLVMIIVLIGFILKNAREKKKVNLGLERKNIEIDLRKNQIAEKNALITDSIEYAKNIQSAILTDELTLKKVLNEGVVFYLPKETVSGDFYWVGVRNSKTYVCVIDCKVHGVPGAFMTVMVYNMLEEIMHSSVFVTPAQILNELNRMVVKALIHKKDESFKDYRMDGILMEIDHDTKQIQYAGANNIFYKVNGEIVTTMLTDVTSIGTPDVNFNNSIVSAEAGDFVFVSTNGYLNNLKDKENPNEMWIALGKINAEEKKNTMMKYIHEDLVDDICVIGFEM